MLTDDVDGLDPSTLPDLDRTVLVRRRSAPERTLAVAVVVLIIVALAVGLVETNHQLDQARAVTGDRAHALAAARTDAAALETYGYRDVEEGVAGLAAHSTPAFASRLEASRSAQRAELVRYRATLSGTVVAAGLTSGGTSRAVALVVLDQTTTSSTGGDRTGRAEPRLSMLLVRQHGDWLLAQVQQG